MEILILTMLSVILGSALFSGMEAALFSVSMSKVKILVEKNTKGAKNLLKVKEHIQRPITVIVIFNNIFNIVGSIMVGALATNILGSSWLGIISAVLTFLIIILGEIIPKSIGENYSEKISLFMAKPLLFGVKIFSPIIWIIEKVTSPFIKKSKIVSEEEIRIMSHLGHLEGSIEQDEKEMIQKVFSLNDLSARDIMTPRTMIDALKENEKLSDVENKIYKAIHSRLPIYAKNFDNIIGICHQRELLIALGRDQKDRKIKEFKQKAIYVPEKMKADELLPLFQKERCHLAIVQDEFGGTAGIVTLEDVLEQLVGEIVDETDRYVNLRKKCNTKN